MRFFLSVAIVTITSMNDNSETSASHNATAPKCSIPTCIYDGAPRPSANIRRNAIQRRPSTSRHCRHRMRNFGTAYRGASRMQIGRYCRALRGNPMYIYVQSRRGAAHSPGICIARVKGKKRRRRWGWRKGEKGSRFNRCKFAN